ncbi:MAG: DUF1493 family protein [Gallionella sp.]|nr:DUF1493 family protein [Gallionella sp.]MDD4946239.1 DUF1493 family protein [Gallionella sp.]MDD5612995.1 DUF1493 family protein [Gallionella sp.]
MPSETLLPRLIELIRSFHRVSPTVRITPETLLEMDLGITGDDGVELIEAIEREFGISFSGEVGSCRDVFGLEGDQCLFHSESFWAKLFEKNVVDLTVGQLLSAILKVWERS